jgi:hypothetical protein
VAGKPKASASVDQTAELSHTVAMLTAELHLATTMGDINAKHLAELETRLTALEAQGWLRIMQIESHLDDLDRLRAPVVPPNGR